MAEKTFKKKKRLNNQFTSLIASYLAPAGSYTDTITYSCSAL